MRLLILLLTLATPAYAATYNLTLPAGRFQFNSLYLRALDKSLDGGCQITTQNHRITFHLDTAKLPRSLDEFRHDARIFTAQAAPHATARQFAHYGLFLPQHVDSSLPLTILIHGLDTDCSDFTDLRTLLDQAGQQTACFVYPNDQPIDESAALFLQHLTALHETFPNLSINILAHSMGSLVARAAIEGPSYPGGVRHLLLIAPPNHGTALAPFRFILELREHYWLWRHDKDWSPTWMITDGLGEAGRDLTPGSQFLNHLNSLPRRPGVDYTIIAGTRNPFSWLWGKLKSPSDGPVPLESTRLNGVADYVALSADHNSLLFSTDHTPPLAWPIIQDRLLLRPTKIGLARE